MRLKVLVALFAATSTLAVCNIPKSAALPVGDSISSSSLDPKSLPQVQLLQVLSGHENSVNSVVLSPDGKTLISNSIGLWTKGNMFASIVRESKGIN